MTPALRSSRLVVIVTLLLVALTFAAARWRAHSTAAAFPRETREHVVDDVARIRQEIVSEEAGLDASADRLEALLSSPRTKPPSRAELFAMLQPEASKRGRGARILQNGVPVAWWGEDLRANAARTYQFDVTNLYITRTRNAEPYVIETYQRIPNDVDAQSPLHPDTRWIDAAAFHGGFLRQEPGTFRHLIARKADSALWIDLRPRQQTDVLEQIDDDGRNVAFLLLTIGAVALIVIHRRNPLLTIVLIVAARAALLGLQVADDPLHIFNYDLYASRLLGPLSKSPFDLMMTAAALFGIVGALRRIVPSIPLLLRGAIAVAAGFGFVALAKNLTNNSRISSIPEHILPASLAQAVLLAALLLFCFTVLRLTRHEGPIRRTLVAVAILVVPAFLLAYALGDVAYVYPLIAVLIALAFQPLTPHATARLFTAAILAVLIVFGPVQLFERAGARKFLADTYAPLVAGESGQLRTMIEDTLHKEFTSTDLSTILPDDYRHMNLEDLAYALWLRSNLSRWRVPAVITVVDDFTGRTISRFGVGLPQFDERAEAVGREVLQLGRLKRVLLHHDFDVTAWGTTIAHGSVHVVNPAEIGATAAADVYRDFFEANQEDANIGLHAQPEPTVYDAEGNIQGGAPLRLPHSPAAYFAQMKTGSGRWVGGLRGENIYLRRTENALFAFPLQTVTISEQVRRAGGVAIWAVAAALLIIVFRSIPSLLELARRVPRALDFRTRTSLYVSAVVILPLLVFVLFVRAYLSNRLGTEYFERGQTALNTGQRIVEDYLNAPPANDQRPEQVLDDEILSWLARVIGHDLHLYRGEQLVASSRR
ncbi:MAG TPA: hypothetical protein VJ276_25415, partial [Thermoanaerobaculia bacterium]|nr:hypothetical protein [Thermoanaerobaculia bacterium]